MAIKLNCNKEKNVKKKHSFESHIIPMFIEANKTNECLNISKTDTIEHIIFCFKDTAL